MKKYYLTFTVLSVIGLLVFFGCSKENNPNKEKQNNVFQPTEQDLQIENKILEFKSKTDFARENPDLKSGGDTLTLEEAIWNIEALLNYNYADASAPFEFFIRDSAIVMVNLTNGNVAMSTATTVYNQIVDSLSAQFDQIPSLDKHLVLANVSLKESDGQIATFSITSGFGEENINTWFLSFDDNDYWKWGLSYDNMGGYCDGPNAGTQTDSDAAEQIETKINHRISLPIGHNYFVEISEVYIDGMTGEITFEPNGVNIYCSCCDLTNPNDITPNDNMYDYYLFRSYSEYPNHHDCLIPDEMNFYLNGMETTTYNIVYNCFPILLENKIFVSTNILGDYWMPPSSITYLHRAWTNYGISVGSGTPPNEL